MPSASKSGRSPSRNFVDALLSVVLAPACAACERPLDEPTRGPVCGVCWESISKFTLPLCRICGDPLPSWRDDGPEVRCCPHCRARNHVVSHGRAIGEYNGSLREIVHALKYAGHRSLARPLAHLMARSGASVLDGADAAVPVPLHRSKKRERGFNQAAEIARHLPIASIHALTRTRATASQTDLPAGARHDNVRNAFTMRSGRRVRGLVVVLIDDVSTTGATVDACARVLLAAGAREVRALTAARVVSRSR
jgi:ComF family protein